MLIVIFGLPGVGKTTVARKIADKLNVNSIEVDSVKNQIAGKTALEKLRVNQQMWPPHIRFKAYKQILEENKRILLNKQHLIIEEIFYRDVFRNYVKNWCKKSGIEYLFVEVICPKKLAAERAQNRYERSRHTAGKVAFLKVKRRFQEMKEDHLIIKSDKDLDNQINKLVQKIF